MIPLAVVCVVGLVAGFLLLRKIPVCPSLSGPFTPSLTVSIVIPARNEEHNLPHLLASIMQSTLRPSQVIVVDDASTDCTAAIAQQHGATVVQSLQLPQGWTGKTWACHQGAMAATSDVLFFLDADTHLLPGGYERILAFFEKSCPRNSALSLLPFHRTLQPYEELSLFFNVFTAIGAGGFTLDRPKLFGQSLLLMRESYWQAGGHEAVRPHVLENLYMASNVYAAGGTCLCLGGWSTLEVRMFPEGFTQLRQSWSKAFASGAGSSSKIVLLVSVLWITAACAAFLIALFATGQVRWVAIAGYLCFVLQIRYFSRQVGTFRWYTALFYPVSLVFYLAIFAQSVLLQRTRSKVVWRGRRL